MSIMKRKRIGFISIARPQFDTGYALSFQNKSVEALKGCGVDISVFDGLVMSENDADKARRWLHQAEPDVLIVQQGTFADSSMLLSILRDISVPILLWGLKEPSVKTGRLRLNSLCGLNLAANALSMIDRPFEYLYGDITEKSINKIISFIKQGCVVSELKDAAILVIGASPKGYYPSDFDELFLRNVWGVKTHRISLDEVFRKAHEVSEDEARDVKKDLEQKLSDFEKIPSEEVDKSVKAYITLRDMIIQTGSAGCAIECWPDFMSEFGGAACFAVSKLTEDGYPTSCEADVYGTLTMLVQWHLTRTPPYLGDLVHVNDEEGTIVFWHCGAGAPSLAQTTITAGDHPNRGVGLCLEYSLKPGVVTIARMGKKGDGSFRMFITCGEAIEAPIWFKGTSVEVKLAGSFEIALDTLIQAGFEHHYSIVYGDISEELAGICKQMNIDVVTI